MLDEKEVKREGKTRQMLTLCRIRYSPFSDGHAFAIVLIARSGRFFSSSFPLPKINGFSRLYAYQIELVYLLTSRFILIFLFSFLCYVLSLCRISLAPQKSIKRTALCVLLCLWGGGREWEGRGVFLKGYECVINNLIVSSCRKRAGGALLRFCDAMSSCVAPSALFIYKVKW